MKKEEIILLALSALAFLYCVGLFITVLCWKAMRLHERLAIAPFFSIGFIVIFVKVLQQHLGIWLISLPRGWVLLGMNAMTLLSVTMIMTMRRDWNSSNPLRSDAIDILTNPIDKYVDGPDA